MSSQELTSEEFAQRCVHLAEDNKGQDCTLLDLSGRTIIADYFVIVTANNNRHAESIINAIVDDTRAAKRKTSHREGKDQSGWLVLDCGDVIVHVFVEHVRAKYDLEHLWLEEFERYEEEGSYDD